MPGEWSPLLGGEGPGPCEPAASKLTLPCSVCGSATEWRCSDCAIDRREVAVCTSTAEEAARALLGAVPHG